MWMNTEACVAWDAILRRMQELRHFDREEGHMRADMLLLEALRLAAEHQPNKEVAEEVELAFRELERWYA